MGTGSFPEVKSGRGVTLTPHPLLVPWSRKSIAITLLPLWAVRPVQSLSACTRVHFTYFTCSNSIIQSHTSPFNKHSNPTCLRRNRNMSTSQPTRQHCHTSNPRTVLHSKVKFSRYGPGVAQRVVRGIALLFYDRGTRRGWVVSSTPRPHFTPRIDPVPILQEAVWAPGPVWTGGKFRPHRN